LPNCRARKPERRECRSPPWTRYGAIDGRAMTLTIGLDAMGGDAAPGIVVDGAVRALE
jgi:hypothetical protein